MNTVAVIFGFYITTCTGIEVSISNNGPAILDANITFTAKLTTADGGKPLGTFYFEFTDRSKGGHNYVTEKSEETEVHWTISYPSSDYSPGTYTMEVTAYRIYSLLPIPIPEGYAKTRYNITNFINGELVYTQNNSRGLEDGFVKTGSETEFRVQFHDPEKFLSRANITYLWSLTDHEDFIPTASPVFRVNFTTPKTYFVQVQVLADFSPPPPPTTTTPATTTPTTTTTSPTTTTATTSTPVTTVSTTSPTTNATTVPTTTATPTISTTTSVAAALRQRRDVAKLLNKEGLVNMSSDFKYGRFDVAVQARDPVHNIQVFGDTWLKHGQVFHIDVSCDGTPDFKYCWEVYVGSYNTTGNESCSDPTVADKCHFSIIHYFRTSETYTIPLIISNDVSKEIYTISVVVYEAVKKTNLSMFLVPVACTALAVLAMSLGAAVVTKANSRLAVETADFDFGQEEEVAEYMSFTDRLKSALSQFLSELQRQPLLSRVSSSAQRKEYGSTERLAENMAASSSDNMATPD